MASNYADEVLIAGNCRDNLVAFGCDDDFMENCKEVLSLSAGDTLSLIVGFSEKDEKLIDNISSQFSTVLQRRIVARTYVLCHIINEAYKNLRFEHRDSCCTEDNINKILSCFAVGNPEPFLEASFPTPFDLKTCYRKANKRFEIDIFEKNIKNEYLQQAINDLIFARDPWTVKTFCNSPNFCTRYTTNGCIVQAPHDFRNVNTKLLEQVIAEQQG